MKKLLALLIVAVMVIGCFASCAKTDDGDSNTTDTKKDEVTTKADETDKDDETTAADDETTEADDETEEEEEDEDETWIMADPTFYAKDGSVVEEPGEGLDWRLFPYWDGYNGTQIYDSNGGGQYVTATFTGKKCQVWFGNGDENGHTNIEIYIDDEFKEAYDATIQGGGIWCTAEYSVESGEHTVKVVAGEPLTDGWNGLTFNCVTFVEG